MFAKKYGGVAYKFQNVVDFLGRIVAFTGVHLGKTHDGKIWSSTMADHPLLPLELVLADGAYIAEPQLIVPFHQPPNAHLTFAQYVANKLISHFRSRVEHSNAKLKKHRILNSKYRGKSMEEITYAGHILANVQNVHQHMHLSYEPFGPYPHF
jgi:hypothetical protein